jgi:hypothetical protein
VGVVAAVVLTVVLASLAGAATAPAAAADESDVEVVSASEDNGTISVSFDRNVSAADDGGEVRVDDVEVYVRQAGAPEFDVYETGFAVSSNSTAEGKVVLTDAPWGDLNPTDTVKVNFTTAVENATATTDSTNVTVANQTASAPVTGYDTDGNGVSIDELGAAAADYVRGDLSIAELGDVAAAYARS